jgi:fatty-acyl-CoA synthase
MLKVGGENVAAVEIESLLATHPSVSIAQVVGVPDPKYIEVPAAFIELKPGAEATEQEIIDFCDGAIARFKVPRYVRFVTEWPMSATKVQKFRLRPPDPEKVLELRHRRVQVRHDEPDVIGLDERHGCSDRWYPCGS